jgi:hypothetical protein
MPNIAFRLMDWIMSLQSAFPLLARIEKTGLFQLVKLEGNKMLLARS